MYSQKHRFVWVKFGDEGEGPGILRYLQARVVCGYEGNGHRIVGQEAWSIIGACARGGVCVL